MAWAEIEVDDWRQLLDYFEQFDYGRPGGVPYLFRGQSDAAWGLTDSLSRLLIAKKGSVNAIELEMAAFQNFVAQAHQFLDPSTLPATASLLAWWALMQHFGAPTRLLDWTASPYIALYFAVLENWERPGAVWAFDPEALTEAIDAAAVERVRTLYSTSTDTRTFFWEQTPTEMVHAFSLKKHHIRISTQQGSFTVCGQIPSDHAALIEKSFCDPKGGKYKKIIIPHGMKSLFLKKLRRMNITASSLFPGLDGLGKAIHELVRLETTYDRFTSISALD